MTEQEQIEEMAEEVICAAITANAKIDDKVAIHLKEFIEILYNAGYRKIDDNCEVITKDDLNLYKKQAVKEFAEKLKEICVRKRQFIDIDDEEEYYFDGAVTIEEIDELLN